jgi:hypothetical protein
MELDTKTVGFLIYTQVGTGHVENYRLCAETANTFFLHTITDIQFQLRKQ